MEAYSTKRRYAREMRTEGVIVLRAAVMNVNAEWIVEGSVERACVRVVYEAMTIGGKGGKSGCVACCWWRWDVLARTVVKGWEEWLLPLGDDGR